MILHEVLERQVMIVHHGNDIDIWQVKGTASTSRSTSRGHLTHAFQPFYSFFRRVQSTARPEKENQANEIRKKANIVPKTKVKRKAREIFRVAVSYPGSREFESEFELEVR